MYFRIARKLKFFQVIQQVFVISHIFNTGLLLESLVNEKVIFY